MPPDECLLVVVQETVNVQSRQAPAPVQKIELDGEANADDVAAELLHELDGGGHGSAGREQVVNNHHALAFFDRVGVNFDRVGSIFEFVGHAGGARGQFFRLADRGRSPR